MAQKTPYIGSTISLISKLDIRYEGVLYNVNSVESTIALATVRAFGTEDRPTANPVLPHDKIYDYIIFKATDIKDLVVCETPKITATQPGGLPYDPAIVSFASTNSPRKPSTSINNGPLRTGPPQTGKSFQQSDRTRMPILPIPKLNSIASLENSGVNRNTGGGGGAGYRPLNNQSYYPKHDGGLARSANSDHSSFNPGNGRNMHFRTTQTSNRLKFDYDYDFEKANEQFKETLESLGIKLNTIKIEVENKEDVVDLKAIDSCENSDVFYDKSFSFFDSISCETRDKTESKQHRLDWKKERQTNQETFGHSAVRSFNYRRGPRGFGFQAGGSRFPRLQYRYTINCGGKNNSSTPSNPCP